MSTGKRQIHISDMNDRPTTLFPLLAFMLLLPGALPVHAWTGASRWSKKYTQGRPQEEPVVLSERELFWPVQP